MSGINWHLLRPSQPPGGYGASLQYCPPVHDEREGEARHGHEGDAPVQPVVHRRRTLGQWSFLKKGRPLFTKHSFQISFNEVYYLSGVGRLVHESEHCGGEDGHPGGEGGLDADEEAAQK